MRNPKFSETQISRLPAQAYHIILAGAGLSGLTLALELARRPAFRDRKILLIDRDTKQQNDRTWCFWATDEEPLPPVIFKSWDRCRFFSAGFETAMDIQPFRYRMVRGIDFYRWAKAELAQYPNVTQLQATILHIDAAAGKVFTDAGEFAAQYMFNSAFTKIPVLPPPSSIYPKPPLTTEDLPAVDSHFQAASRKSSVASRQSQVVHLLQHFKGWLIETPAPTFDPAAVTFMDFRIEQRGETRFVYVLPFSETRALVEFTVFSPALLSAEEYRSELEGYLHKFLKINSFEILEEEFGVIPMTDFPFPAVQEGKLMHIGTAGGFVKASSGYAFKRTQRKIRAFADAWERTGMPNPAMLRSPWLFRAFDSIFLRVLANRNDLGSIIFTRLFQKLPATLVLRFLDEDSGWKENLRLISAPPTFPFLKAFWQQLPFLHRR